MQKTATDNDHRIIDATSIALKGLIGRDDDVDRLIYQIEISYAQLAK